MDENIEKLQEVLRSLSMYEKKGLDVSYLKLFIKNYKLFLEINSIKPDYTLFDKDKKLFIVEKFLSDTSIFPRIIDVINFVNEHLHLSFKSQNASRETTIQRIIKRIEKEPEVKNKLKNTLQLISKQEKPKKKTTTKKLENSDDLIKWAEMLKDI